MADVATPPRLAAVVGGDQTLRDALAHRFDDEGLAVTGALAGGRRLDVLVFIAQGRAQGFAATPVEAFSRHVGGELRSAFLTLQAGVAAMRAKGAGGSVVFVAPPSSGSRAFDALQQGLRLLVKAAALELGPEGIRVNIVLPGTGENPLGRACAPEDVAASIAFAASDRALFMTGADLIVDGGRRVA